MMSPAITETLSWLAHWLPQLLGAGVIGGLIGSYATHRFTLKRERDTGRRDRRREFRSFVVQLRSEAADLHWRQEARITTIRSGVSQAAQNAFGNYYQSKKAQLRSAAANVASDFTGKRRQEFDCLVDTAAGFAPEQMDSFHERQEQLVVALDAILNF